MSQKKIGNVIIDYKFFNPALYYSDGDIENVLLDAAKENRLDNLLYNSKQWAVLYHCSDVRENLLEWYPFRKDATLLEVGSGCGALTGLFARKVKSVTCIELSERRTMINAYRNQNYDNINIILGNFQDIKLTEKYDYITLIGVWEYAGYYIDSENPYLSMLTDLKKHLKEDGKLIIAIENKTGLKYWNGALEEHLGKRYKGLNDYIGENKIRTFSKPELEDIFKEAGINTYKFYYPNPDYKLPETIYTDEKLPKVGEIRNYRKDYDTPRIYNFNDAVVSDQLCKDGMYTYFANSFLIECGPDCSDIVYAKYSRMRKEEYRIATVISKTDDGYKVYKKALNDKAKKHIENLGKCNIESVANVDLIHGNIVEEQYLTEYIEGKQLDIYFYKYRNNIPEFINQVKNIIDSYFINSDIETIEFTITPEYEKLFGKSYVKNSRCLEATNVDMIFSNLFLQEDGKIFCIDNEWIFNFPIPLEYTLWRAVSQLYGKYASYFKDCISKKDFLIAVGLNAENFPIYEDMEREFQKKILGDDYKLNYRKPVITLDVQTVL